MYLSRLRLDPRDLLALRDLGDVGEFHRTLMRGFPHHDGPTPRQEFGVLFRVEPGSFPPVVLVQSLVEPRWEEIPPGYLLEHEHVDAKHVLDAAGPGRVLRFLLVANPTRKSAAHREDEPPPRNSRRVALASDAERLTWLQNRGERHGFALHGGGPALGVRVEELAPSGRGGSGRSGIYVRRVLFEGALRVTEPGRFRQTLRTGLGPAKAYGCGLLSVAPLE